MDLHHQYRIKMSMLIKLLSLVLYAGMCLSISASNSNASSGNLPIARYRSGSLPHGVLDPQEGKLYTAYCSASPNVAQLEGEVDYKQRFLVYVPTSAQLPLAERTAQLLALLYTEVHSRFHWDHPYRQTLKVWLTDGPATEVTPDAGGEQIRDNIYIFDLSAPRSPGEWFREITHEYGHYSLPGVTGFTQPEAWANGFLGQRLYPYWIHQDLKAKKIASANLVFINSAGLKSYLQKQVYPLLQEIGTEKMPDEHLLNGTYTASMNYYTGWVVYLNAVYGVPVLFNALCDTHPLSGKFQDTAPAFIQGALRAIRQISPILLRAPITNPSDSTITFPVYLPAGKWRAKPSEQVHSYSFEPMYHNVKVVKNIVTIMKTGWYRLSLDGSSSTTLPSLLLTRTGE